MLECIQIPRTVVIKVKDGQPWKARNKVKLLFLHTHAKSAREQVLPALTGIREITERSFEDTHKGVPCTTSQGQEV